MIDGFCVIDLHVHSELSGCADKPPLYTAERVLRHAARLGIDGVGFSDHVLEPQAALPRELTDELEGRPGLERPAQLRKILAGTNALELPPFIIGAEVDAFGGGLFAITPEGRRSLDFVAMSANHPTRAGMSGPGSADADAVARHTMDVTREAVRSGLATSLAHPLIPLHSPEIGAAAYARYVHLGLEGLLEDIRDAGIIFGFSRHLVTHSHLFRPRDVQTVYQLAARVGVSLAFETDCHQLWHMSCIVPLVELARKISLSPAHFITALPARQS